MIGLPTIASSRISSRVTPARAASPREQPAERLAHRLGHLAGAALVEHRVGDAAHEVLAEPDLRVHHAVARRGPRRRRGRRGARRSSSSRRRSRRRAPGRGARARRAMTRAPVVDRDGDPVVARVERRLERADDVEVRLEAVEPHSRASASNSRARSPPGVARSGRSTSTSYSRTTGSMTKSRTGRPLRTTWRWTWLSGGTSTRTSPWTCGRQPRRRSAARPAQRRTPPRRRRAARGARRVDSMPCFGNEPSAGTTWQRPHRPRPPHTESRSTPSERAASRTVVPGSNRPRRPDGVKMTWASPAISGAVLRAVAAALLGGAGPGGRCAAAPDGSGRRAGRDDLRRHPARLTLAGPPACDAAVAAPRHRDAPGSSAPRRGRCPSGRRAAMTAALTSGDERVRDRGRQPATRSPSAGTRR